MSINNPPSTEANDNAASIKELGKKLSRIQRSIIQNDIPVVILIDGWENSGKGEVINHLTRELDPRFYNVAVFDDDRASNPKYNYMLRFWRHLPAKGHITIYDRSLYFKAFDNLNKSLSDMAPLLEDIYGFVRMLVDNGTIVIKLFLDMSHKVQKKRLAEFEKAPFKKLFLRERDYDQEKRYTPYSKHFRNILSRTSQLYGSWNIIPTDNLKAGCKLAMESVITNLEVGISAIERQRQLSSADMSSMQKNMVLPSLTQATLASNNDNLHLSGAYPSAIPNKLFIKTEESQYETELPILQEKARLLSLLMYICGISTICAFEGQDAAGKGGAIKRLTKSIDPRGYDIYQTAAPTREEFRYHYMRRFLIYTPPPGKMAIFDRTWYGRVLVERVENFATTNEWQRAYQEINTMELHWIHSGINLFKFFLAIDNDEQLNRFNMRQSLPDKQFKITEEDWRNREKWNDYNDAYQEMFYRTSTSVAPWVIVEGNNKHYARLKVLRVFIEQSYQRLKEYKVDHPDVLDWKNFETRYKELDKLLSIK